MRSVAVVAVGILVLALFGPLLAPFAPTPSNIPARLSAPGGASTP